MIRTMLTGGLVRWEFPEYKPLIIKQFNDFGLCFDQTDSLISFDIRLLFQKDYPLKIFKTFNFKDVRHFLNGVIINPNTMIVVDGRLPKIKFIEEPKENLQEVHLRIWLEMIIPKTDRLRVTENSIKKHFRLFADGLKGGIYYLWPTMTS
jgi:hypothetical protein